MNLTARAYRVLTALAEEHPDKDIQALKPAAADAMADDVVDASKNDINNAVDAAAETLVEKKKRPMTLAVDFDGVLVEKAEYPNIGPDMPGAVDSLRTLIEKGWRPFIFSSRAWSGTGKQQIRQWLDERGFNAVKVVAKPFASRYIDDLNVRFDGNWPAVERELSGQTLLREEALAVRLDAGLCTMREFCETAGYHYPEFYADITKLSSADSAAFAVLRKKYGMIVEQADYTAATDKSLCIRNAAAAYMRRVAHNDLYIGDQVVDLSTGKSGFIKALAASESTLSDGDADWQVKTASIMLRPHAVCTEKHAGLYITASRAYPDGLHRQAVKAYYTDNLSHFYGFAKGRKLFGVYASAAGTLFGKAHRITAREDLANFEAEGLSELRMAPEELSDIAWIDAPNPAGGKAIPQCVLDAVDMLGSARVMSADGSRYIIMVMFPEPIHAEQARATLQPAADRLADMVEPGAHDSVLISPETGMPCPGSLDPASGCVFECKDTTSAELTERTIC